jgi:hypothetical protein
MTEDQARLYGDAINTVRARRSVEIANAQAEYAARAAEIERQSADALAAVLSALTQREVPLGEAADNGEAEASNIGTAA